MTKFLIALALFCLISVSTQSQPQKAETPFQHLISVRERLIKKYVLGNHYAKSVSVCGDSNPFNGEEREWLTVYVYSDTVMAFAKDFIANEIPQIDVDIVLEQIDRER